MSGKDQRATKGERRPSATSTASASAASAAAAAAAASSSASKGHAHGHGLDADKTVQKFKTKVCLFWLQPGGCPYGDKCLYAHGASDQREDLTGGTPGNSPATNVKYKTVVCKHWVASHGSSCPHGLRCTYAHGPQELQRYQHLAQERTKQMQQQMQMQQELAQAQAQAQATKPKVAGAAGQLAADAARAAATAPRPAVPAALPSVGSGAGSATTTSNRLAEQLGIPADVVSTAMGMGPTRPKAATTSVEALDAAAMVGVSGETRRAAGRSGSAASQLSVEEALAGGSFEPTLPAAPAHVDDAALEPYRGPDGNVDVRRMPAGLLAAFLNKRFTEARQAAVAAGLSADQVKAATKQLQLLLHAVSPSIAGDSKKTLEPVAAKVRGHVSPAAAGVSASGTAPAAPHLHLRGAWAKGSAPVLQAAHAGHGPRAPAHTGAAVHHAPYAEAATGKPVEREAPAAAEGGGGKEGEKDKDKLGLERNSLLDSLASLSSDVRYGAALAAFADLLPPLPTSLPSPTASAHHMRPILQPLPSAAEQSAQQLPQISAPTSFEEGESVMDMWHAPAQTLPLPPPQMPLQPQAQTQWGRGAPPPWPAAAPPHGGFAAPYHSFAPPMLRMSGAAQPPHMLSPAARNWQQSSNAAARAAAAAALHAHQGPPQGPPHQGPYGQPPYPGRGAPPSHLQPFPHHGEHQAFGYPPPPFYHGMPAHAMQQHQQHVGYGGQGGYFPHPQMPPHPQHPGPFYGAPQPSHRPGERTSPPASMHAAVPWQPSFEAEAGMPPWMVYGGAESAPSSRRSSVASAASADYPREMLSGRSSVASGATAPSIASSTSAASNLTGAMLWPSGLGGVPLAAAHSAPAALSAEPAESASDLWKPHGRRTTPPSLSSIPSERSTGSTSRDLLSPSVFKVEKTASAGREAVADTTAQQPPAQPQRPTDRGGETGADLAERVALWGL
jgi:hypothetical protein